MQQLLTLNTTTALSEASRSTRSAAVSAATGTGIAGMYHACSAAAPYCIFKIAGDSKLAAARWLRSRPLIK
jgi:hypothetical protein